MRRNAAYAVALSLALVLTACAPAAPQAQTATETLQPLAEEDRDVPFVPTPDEVVAQMLAFGQPPENGLLIDLGSGDGRIVIAAARATPGLKGLGVDLDPKLIVQAREGAAAAGVGDRATFRQEDLFKTDFSAADVVTMYLLPEVNLQLREKVLSTMKPGARVVSHAFDMGDWEPDQQIDVPRKDGGSARVYQWIVPANFAGEWKSEDGAVTISLKQSYQMLSGEGRDKTGVWQIEGGKAKGTEASLTWARGAASETIAARLDGATLVANFDGKQVRFNRTKAAPIRMGTGETAPAVP
jgi:precorrin-6B methylase 2